MIKLLATGGNGQVGWELAQLLLPENITLLTLSHAQWDITNAQQVKQVIAEHNPALVINCAAYTAVDKAETDAERAFAINRDGAAMLAEACAKQAIPLIHVSTDYIFDGEKSTPYQEDDAGAPINIYGASKFAGENAVRAILDNHLILRVSSVFSAHGHNFVKTLLRLAQEKETLSIVDDQIMCPTPAAAIAKTLITLSEQLLTDTQKTRGTYHYCGNEPTSWYTFADAIRTIAKRYAPLKVKEILPIPTEKYPTPAKRPHYSVLDCSKLQQQFSLPPCCWREGLDVVISQLLST